MSPDIVPCFSLLAQFLETFGFVASQGLWVRSSKPGPAPATGLIGRLLAALRRGGVPRYAIRCNVHDMRVILT